MITGTAAQTPMPRTVPLVNNTTKETVGTATFSGNSIYLRDIKGELYAIATIERDGTKTLRDPNGKVLDTIPSKPK